jgi:hypothetical protein
VLCRRHLLMAPSRGHPPGVVRTRRVLTARRQPGCRPPGAIAL